MATADPGVGSWNPINIFAMIRALVNNGCPVVSNAGAPSNGASGTYVGLAGKGSVLIDFTNGNLYLQTGSLTSVTWSIIGQFSSVSGDVAISASGVATIQANAVTSSKVATSLIQTVSGQITSAQITGTTAGMLGHANGVVMVPAAPAGAINEFISTVAAMDFSGIAYTGGGNVSVNISGGGAALSGVVTTTVFIQAAADLIIEWVPLAATKNVYTSANGLAMVSASAPTQPGTAAGVINWFTTYRTIPSLLD